MPAYEEDTIAAISTAMAPAGIGIVRISGKDSFSIADRIYVNKKNKKLADQKGYTIHYGHIADKNGVIDEVLVMLMRAPHSYTGEDTVEIDCHGGILATRRVLEAAIRAGARPAEPGEYSKRAFLNGRMDLSQAEAVMDVISAKNDNALRSAQQQLSGFLSDKIRSIRQALLYETAHIEAALDDPEHMSLDGCEGAIRGVVQKQQEEIQKLIDTADSGKMMQEGIKTVIVGKPNAGKSSLLNLLAGEEKAIVTDIAGTTRDVLEENVNIRGITLRLLDTAGIRDTSDTIEKIGVDRAKKQLADADLVLFVADSSVLFDENDREILRLVGSRKTIVIQNKSDLPSVFSTEDLKSEILSLTGRTGVLLADADAEEAAELPDECIPVLPMSAKRREGLETLEAVIEKLFFRGKLDFNDEVYITNVRHKAALEEAAHSLDYVLDSIDRHMPEDFWSIDLMGACDALGKITGESLGEDLVNEIFAKFCMGK